MQHNKDYNMLFLKQKINEIKSALFKTGEIDLELQLPNNVIDTLKVGDDGMIWFLTAFKGYELATMSGKPFFATLDYYKKEDNCRLRISGEAAIVQNDDEPLTKNYAADNYKTVLVVMKIKHAEFYEKIIFTNLSWQEKVKSTINQLFSHYPRVYDFS